MARALALDVTDAGVLGVGEGGVLVGPSPGYAVVEEGAVLVGAGGPRPRPPPAALRDEPLLGAARRRAPRPAVPRRAHRRRPGPRPPAEPLERTRQRGSRRWSWRCPASTGRRPWAGSSASPRPWRCPVVGLVDAAVAAAAVGFPGERLLLADVHLHRATVTELRQAEEIVRERVATIDRWGLEEVHDALARRIAQSFVHKTRFDPFHAAETEQALHDRLPDWLERLRARGPRALSLSGWRRERARDRGDAGRRRGLGPELRRGAGAEGEPAPAPGEPTTLLVSARAARLPGPRLPTLAMRGTEVAARRRAGGGGGGAPRARFAAPAETGGGLPFVTRLARREPSPEDASLGGGASSGRRRSRQRRAAHGRRRSTDPRAPGAPRPPPRRASRWSWAPPLRPTPAVSASTARPPASPGPTAASSRSAARWCWRT